ncbi:GNAT family N-acetyltransferase [Pusillimonas sp. CC-YST705]|uniref:GNAT family N-acetyltransferase n=1 Tax=Mesopusillimonas faecipullorum TaxID=2755040 RepID=A0ABS8C9E9_9BURK|nr:GNAT family N-acetyltransferase [Mesopusillimonas faecipullorum]MCB5362623.1 GNAT family N-acetyltransferase [Mesopusillimonas faecipullorum]
MPRHRLSPLFEPRSLLVVSEHPLPALAALQPGWQAKATQILLSEQDTLQLPESLAGVAPGERLDLALVCTQPERLPMVLGTLAAVRPRVVVLLHAGTLPENRQELAAYCMAWARLHNSMVLGPNSLGLQRPGSAFNFSRVERLARSGQAAVVTHSDSLMAAVLDWAEDVRLGFSTVMSMGDEAQLSIAQVLDFLATDSKTDSIALYMDHAPAARELASALRAASSVKPVVVLRTIDGQGRPTMHQTVFDALLRRAGVVRVRYFVQLFSAIKVLRYHQRPKGPSVAIFSNGRAGVRLAASVMAEASAIEHARLTMATRRDLQALPGIQVDSPGDAVIAETGLSPEAAAQAVQLLAQDKGVHGVLVLLAPSPLLDLAAVTQALAQVVPRAGKPVITCFMGEAQARELRRKLDEVGAPAFRTPESAAHAFSILAAHDYNQRLALQILPAESLGHQPEMRGVRAMLAHLREQGRRELGLDDCRHLLTFFHFPWRYFGAVADGLDMSIRIMRDDRLGPYLWFGGQGYAVQPGDSAIELPPLNHELARRLIQRSPLWHEVLATELSVDALEQLLDVLICLSDLACEVPALESFSLDLRLADGNHMGLGRIKASLLAPEDMQAAWDGPGYRHMAIHPYPRELVQPAKLRDGTRWVMRPIRPEDAQKLQGFVRSLSDESRYMRFIYLLRELTPSMLARYSRIDYDRELALVATVQVPNPAHRGFPEEQIVGLAHYFLQRDRRGAEFALVVHDEWQRHGLGSQLMRGMIEAAKRQGLDYLEGQVLDSNYAMRKLLVRLGFQDLPYEDDATLRRLWLALDKL